MSRLLRLFDTSSQGCWPWLGCKNKHGYGNVNGKTYGTKMAHRAVYEKLVGPIPANKELDHLCRNRACVNPTHLEPVDRKTNCRRSVCTHKTHCVRGHVLTPDNRYITKDDHWECRTCRKSAMQRFWAKQRV